MLSWQGCTTRGRCWVGRVVRHVAGVELARSYDMWQVLGGSQVDELASDTWHIGGEWIGDTWPKQLLPRVTWELLKICGVCRTRPRDLRAKVYLWEGPPNRRATHVVLTTIWFWFYLNLHCIIVWAWSGPGISPGPHSHVDHHTTTYARILNGVGTPRAWTLGA